MKKILLPILSLILAACSSSQVAVTRSAQVTVTSPPPTATPIPTPTLHPQFVALQTQVAASGERFTLAPDGTIQDGAIAVSGLFVDKNGAITLQGDSLPAQAGSQVIISPEDVSFDDEKGVSVEGYTLDEATGKWGVGISEAESAAIALFDKYGVAPDTYTLTEVDGVIVGTDKETGVEIFRDGRFEINYAIEIAKKDCEPTNIEPQKGGSLVQQKDQDLLKSYMHALSNKYIPSSNSNYYFLAYILIDREKQCWGFADGDVLVYRNENGSVRIVPTIHLTEDEVDNFMFNR